MTKKNYRKNSQPKRTQAVFAEFIDDEKEDWNEWEEEESEKEEEFNRAWSAQEMNLLRGSKL